MKRVVFLAVCLLVLAVGSASADTINLTTSSPGSWSLSAGGVGSSVLSSSTSGVTVGTSPNPSPLFFFVGGYTFTFTTGVLSSIDGVGYHFAGGGSICLYLTFCGDPTPGATLFSGTFTGASLVQTGSSLTFSASFVGGAVDPVVLVALGIANPTTGVTGSLVSSMSGAFAPGGGGDTSGITANLQQVPEPASMALLGTGMVALGSFARRKLNL